MDGDFVLWMPRSSRWNFVRSNGTVPLVNFLKVLNTCRDYGLGKPSTFTEWCGDLSLTSARLLNTLCISMWCGDRGRPALPWFRIGPYPGDVGPDPNLGSGWERSGERGLWSMLWSACLGPPCKVTKLGSNCLPLTAWDCLTTVQYWVKVMKHDDE